MNYIHAKVQVYIIWCVLSKHTLIALVFTQQTCQKDNTTVAQWIHWQRLKSEYVSYTQNRGVSVDFGFGQTISFGALKKPLVIFASRCVSKARAFLITVSDRNSQQRASLQQNLLRLVPVTWNRMHINKTRIVVKSKMFETNPMSF